MKKKNKKFAPQWDPYVSSAFKPQDQVAEWSKKREVSVSNKAMSASSQESLLMPVEMHWEDSGSSVPSRDSFEQGAYDCEIEGPVIVSKRRRTVLVPAPVLRGFPDLETLSDELRPSKELGESVKINGDSFVHALDSLTTNVVNDVMLKNVFKRWAASKNDVAAHEWEISRSAISTLSDGIQMHLRTLVGAAVNIGCNHSFCSTQSVPLLGERSAHDVLGQEREDMRLTARQVLEEMKAGEAESGFARDSLEIVKGSCWSLLSANSEPSLVSEQVEKLGLVIRKGGFRRGKLSRF